MDYHKVVAIGNGESRKDLNLQLLTGKYPLIGCNAVHRDAIVDHLICCDTRMVYEAIQNINTSHTKIYTRSDWLHQFVKNNNVTSVPEIPYSSTKRPDLPRNWGSGCYALLLAATMSKSKIYMIGFDLYGLDNKLNNVYKDTKNYRLAESNSIDPAYWIYQSYRVFTIFSESDFHIFNHSDWRIPDSWKLPNVKIFDIKDFFDHLYNN